MERNFTLSMDSQTENSVVIRVKGELHSADATEFTSQTMAYIDAIPALQEVVLQLEDLTYASSSGIGSLMEIYKQVVMERRGTLRLENTRPMIRDVIDLLGYSSWIGSV